jgi:hypothetical protein
VDSLVSVNGFGGTSALAWIDVGRAQVAVPGSSVDTSIQLASAGTGERAFIHLVDDALYWSESTAQKIGRLKKGDSAPVRFDVAPYDIDDFAVVGNTLFVTINGSGGNPFTLMRGTFGTTAVEGLAVVDTIGYPEHVAFDGSSIIVLSDDGVRTCPSADCRSLSTVALQHSPDAHFHFSGLYVDATTIWFGSSDGVIYGVAK